MQEYKLSDFRREQWEVLLEGKAIGQIKFIERADQFWDHYNWKPQDNNGTAELLASVDDPGRLSYQSIPDKVIVDNVLLAPIRTMQELKEYGVIVRGLYLFKESR